MWTHLYQTYVIASGIFPNVVSSENIHGFFLFRHFDSKQESRESGYQSVPRIRSNFVAHTAARIERSA